MTLRKFLKISVGLFLVFIIVVGLIYKSHPIIIKWLDGSARTIGKPIKATVYTNGQINQEIKVFHVDRYWGNPEKADYYILYVPYLPDNSELKFFCVNRKDKYVGRPNSTNVEDYDFLFGRLLQSDVGGHFDLFQNNMKGYDFNPELTFNDKEIRFKIPPHAKEIKCDSIRIEL